MKKKERERFVPEMGKGKIKHGTRNVLIKNKNKMEQSQWIITIIIIRLWYYDYECSSKEMIIKATNEKEW